MRSGAAGVATSDASFGSTVRATVAVAVPAVTVIVPVPAVFGVKVPAAHVPSEAGEATTLSESPATGLPAASATKAGRWVGKPTTAAAAAPPLMEAETGAPTEVAVL
jgi:hypothetical protein